jgi:hypothetical protein
MDVMHIGASVSHNIIVAIIAVGGGFVGGLLHDLIQPKPSTLRAERFEVVDRSGRIASYWGPDADPQIPNTTPRGTLLVFSDPHGVRRCQIGSRAGDTGPELLFFGRGGPTDGPRVGIELGGTGSPSLHMRGQGGDKMDLGAMYGDVSGRPELGWGLSFRAWDVQASAGIGYSRWWDGTYRSAVSLTNGAGKTWEAIAGDKLKPIPLARKPTR